LKILTLKENIKGTDYVVGDIHGFFGHLELLLDMVDFNPNIDRLICCGDLVDRGPRSHEVIDWINKPWFFSVMGNHDAYYAYRYEKNTNSLLFWFKEKERNWFFGLPEEFQRLISLSLKSLPLVIEVESKDKLYGVVHGGVPYGITWQSMKDKILSNKMISCRGFMWNRKVAKDIQKGLDVIPVIGVDCVFSGHTVSKSGIPIHSGNRAYIDTGAGYLSSRNNVKLTICELNNINNYKQI
jgi:serine/threonine protein phosphatase 1